MHGTYDKSVDAACLYLSAGKIEMTEVISDYLNFDLDREGKIVGIEFLDAKKHLAEETLQSFGRIG